MGMSCEMLIEEGHEISVLDAKVRRNMGVSARGDDR
jgi:hypothetical protein